MAYTDPDGVRLALTPGGDESDTGSAAYLSDADLTAAIDDATDEVNAKLSSKYQVPFSPVPDMVARITATIAGYLATLTARQGDPMPPGDPVLLRYTRAQQLLTQLQSGQMTLAGDTAGDPVAGAAAVVANPLDRDLFDLGDFPTEPVLTWPHRLTCE